MLHNDYYLRDAAGRYLTIDKEGSFKALANPVPVTGVPESVTTGNLQQPITFTGQARNILSRIQLTPALGGPDAICFVAFGDAILSLNFHSMQLKPGAAVVLPDTPDQCARIASAVKFQYGSWLQLALAR